jgi:hypothetical protein
MSTYTIDWSDNITPPPIHSGLDVNTLHTTLRRGDILEMKEEILCSLDDVGLKSNKRIHKWELLPLSYSKVELRGYGKVFVGWIRID